MFCFFISLLLPLCSCCFSYLLPYMHASHTVIIICYTLKFEILGILFKGSRYNYFGILNVEKFSRTQGFLRERDLLRAVLPYLYFYNDFRLGAMSWISSLQFVQSSRGLHKWDLPLRSRLQWKNVSNYG